jgi:hypothetical protein
MWKDPYGNDHGCTYPGCDRFGSFGTKRRNADGSTFYVWRCAEHQGLALPPERAPPAPKGPPGTLL